MSQRVGGGLPERVSIGVLAASVPRDVVDEAVAVCGRQAQRAGGKLPPHVVVYFAMALALFGDDDYEEVMARLTEALVSWGSVGPEWVPPTTGGITQARQRLGSEVLREVFERAPSRWRTCSHRARSWARGAWWPSTTPARNYCGASARGWTCP